MQITFFSVQPLSMVTNSEKPQQRIELEIHAERTAHLVLQVIRDGEIIADGLDLPVLGGEYKTFLLLPVPEKDSAAQWNLFSRSGELLSTFEHHWEVPREWDFYIVASSHMDIGLHNSQYIQRFKFGEFLDKAALLADQTSSRPEESRYHYALEGTYFWNHYAADRGKETADRIARDYIKKDRIAIGGATAGNVTQTYGLEEMCRSAYTRNRLKNQWDIDTGTMTMIDNNGISWPLVNAYTSAGFKNIFFAPNQWNPLPSTVFTSAALRSGQPPVCNPDAGGGGSLVDVRYNSHLPMVFYWQGADEKSKLLVWSSTQYNSGGHAFGLSSRPGTWSLSPLKYAESCFAYMLPRLERKYPYDLWMLASYSDDENPDLFLTDLIEQWNSRWKWPRLQTVGNFDKPFELLQQKFGDKIPVLRGDITGGWYLLALSVPQEMSRKFQADRDLPTAEKLAVAASCLNPSYAYPAEAFDRAWNALIWNDEHSYGASGYSGRRVYETWIQHRDWIRKAQECAEAETKRAMEAIAQVLDVPEESLLLFNPTLIPRKEILEFSGEKFLSPEVPSFGYTLLPLRSLEKISSLAGESKTPPEVENRFYRVIFKENGAIKNVYDKDLKRFLFDENDSFAANEFVYTSDNHKSFVTPGKAVFFTGKTSLGIEVRSVMEESVSGCAIEQKVFLPEHEKRIDIENRLDHLRDLVNKNRYFRYGYYAFPFRVEGARRYAALNGCIASPVTDQTGHGSETYLAPREWCCVENDSFGAALLQLDSQVLEFDHIHPDKTDAGMEETGEKMYSALFNDWIQMHVPGGSHISLRFRYSITSYSGDFRKAHLVLLAERFSHPLCCLKVDTHCGSVKDPSRSFLCTEQDNLRLLALKRPEDGKGIILRFLETEGRKIECVQFHQTLIPSGSVTRNTLDERPFEEGEKTETCAPFNYWTGRIGAESYSWKCVPEKEVHYGEYPAPVGSVYSGLIDEPCGACGGEDGQLYLLWGQNKEEDLSHYELYRSEQEGFTPSPENFVAKVEPGEYVVVPYEDKGLKTHCSYYYRVRAVNQKGLKGEFSREFSAVTREMI